MFYKNFMSIMNEINFDELEHIRQSNSRDSQYQLKRTEPTKFIISSKGKSIIGHNATMGIDLRAGNGSVLIAVRPKDDARCTRGLLNGATGKVFTSSRLEDALQSNNLVSEFYNFEFKQEWEEGKYFALISSEVAEDEADPTPDDTDADQQEDFDQAEHQEEDERESKAVNANVESVNDDF